MLHQHARALLQGAGRSVANGLCGFSFAVSRGLRVLTNASCLPSLPHALRAHCACRDDTCVFVSQSGETADTLRALEYAKVRGGAG